MNFSPHAQSNIKKYIDKYLQPEYTVHETTVCMLDSNDITDKIRSQILDEIKKSKSENIIVTHGTDTMAATARSLDGKVLNKRVILVGAFKPLVFAPSDAAFNLGFAVASFENLKNGVYVAMNSQIFNAATVEKDFKKMKFVTK
jgi:L-asparaginase